MTRIPGKRNIRQTPRRRRSAKPLKLEVAKALDSLKEKLSEPYHYSIDLNQQKVLQRIERRLKGTVDTPLTEADLTNIKKIAKQIGLEL